LGVAELAAIAAIGQAGLSLAGAGASAAGSRVSGSLQKTQSYLQAQEMRRKAVDVEAATDRTVRNMNEDAERVLSAQRAAMASQGTDTTATGAVDLSSKIAERVAGEGLYERQRGIQQASDLIKGAGLTETAGDAAKRAGSAKSLGTLIGGAGTAVGQLAPVAKGAGGFSSWLQQKGKGSSSLWGDEAGAPAIRYG
jgi:hypothetical protein